MKNFFTFLLLLGKTHFVFADEDASTVIKYEESVSEKEQVETRPVEALFQNPAISSGITSGVDAINKSVDTLIESIFYNLMKNQVNVGLNDTTSFLLGLRRDVYDAPGGIYVIVDQFQFGPQYSKNLWSIGPMATKLGLNGNIQTADIYLRSDPLRVIEQESLPLWRKLANDWLGLNTILSWILPPSYNPNYLYDPLHRAEMIFNAPLSMQAVNHMPVGHIHTHAVTGGIVLGMDLAENLGSPVRDQLTKLNELEVTVPYSIFREGEYRIHVLKIDEQRVWVGANDLSRRGHSILANLGKTLYLFHDTVRFWKGAPVNIFPFDFEFNQSVSNIISAIYEYDLKNPFAQQAYLKAVKGDFLLSWQFSNDFKKTGVLFHHKKWETKQETKFNNRTNLSVFRKERAHSRSSSEITVRDRLGKYESLEVVADHEDISTDLLRGKSTQKTTAKASFNVVKLVPKSEDGGSTYKFTDEPNPAKVLFTLTIQDRFVDIRKLRQYIRALTSFTLMDLSSLPQIPLREREHLKQYAEESYFENDVDIIRQTHVLPAYVGAFEARSALYFDYKSFDKAARKSLDEKWRAFALGFDIPLRSWKTHDDRETGLNRLSWLVSNLMFPFRWFYVPTQWVDAYRETLNFIEYLDRWQATSAPEKKQEIILKLFSTNHPIPLVRGLFYLVGSDDIPRQLKLVASPKGPNLELKRIFHQYDGRTFAAGGTIPPLDRFEQVRLEEGRFTPLNLSLLPKKLKIVRMFFSHEKQVEGEPHIFLFRLEVPQDGHVGKPLRLYIRFEEAERLKIGNFKLLETVQSLKPTSRPTRDPRTQEFEVRLGDPKEGSEIFVPFGEIENGIYRLTVAASWDEQIWSDEKSLNFKMENGKLMPIEN